MRYEHEWEDGGGFNFVRPTKKTKFRDADLAPKRAHTTRLRQLRLPTPYKQTTETIEDNQDDPNDLLSLTATLPSPQRVLVELFVLRKGPQAVVNNIKADQRIHPDIPITTGPRAYHELMIRGTGITYERLAHLWLREQQEKRDTLVLDLGSTHRVFRTIAQFTQVYLNPDGAIFTHTSSRPTLAAICEYKTNIQLPHAQEILQRQISSMRAFAQQFGGTDLNIRLKVDIRNRITFPGITIARHPEILLVIPQDHQAPINIPEDVTVLNSPFDRKLISEVAWRCARGLLL